MRLWRMNQVPDVVRCRGLLRDNVSKVCCVAATPNVPY
jgi:hypothetical protein